MVDIEVVTRTVIGQASSNVILPYLVFPPTDHCLKFLFLWQIKIVIHRNGIHFVIKLSFQAEGTKVTEVDFNPDFIARMIPRVEWRVLYEAAQSVSVAYFLDLLYL